MSALAPRALARAALFAVIAGLAAVDLVGDARGGVGVAHLVGEGALTLLALVGLWLEARSLVRALRRARADADELRERLRETQVDAERWARETKALAGELSAAIDAQLDKWGLTPAEKETTLLLLKGLSHKEISEVRGVGEASARQQARSIYRKAGLSGRHDLAAFFLEDVLSGAAPGDERRAVHANAAGGGKHPSALT